ncbi:MAG TPA: hypothetical protein VJM07_09410 [Gaiella sp.]|nr:hypothetical protein [Gaiella sp.]
MKHGKLLRIGGYLSGGVLILFGIVVIALGVWGIAFTRDHLQQEGIVFGPASDPAVAEHAAEWAGEPVETGSQALAFAEIMREHTLASTDGLTYAQMGRFQSAEDPGDPAGTNDESAAAKDANGQPVSNGARDIWVTETALTTALNMSFMSEMLAVFSIVVGIALLLTGIGLVLLAMAVFGRWRPEAEAPSPLPGPAVA